MQKYLTKQELDSVLKVAKQRGDRDYAIVLLSYLHGLRCTELLNLKWEFIDWDKKIINILRVKGSDSYSHYLQPNEIRLLKRLKRSSKSEFIISGRQSDQLTTARVRQMCKEMGIKANLNRPFHHHMLRHTCGFDMADNRGIRRLDVQRYLGHRDPRSTEVYIREAGRDFKDLPDWRKCQ